ncbi:hypothetical protein HBN84_21845 [Pseudomonas lundensis]|uniref:HdeA/HdeB family chaperone n=1 Tax=Pseudomonas lundensis TaxID=86185 RepID=UPI001474F59C|nr:HdeA/HdeB family chaperone [Pseudomonas lundensis]NNA27912.1 hypothetical protein [Pseudomonas lundensis]
MKKHLLILGTASLVALSTLAQAADTKQPVSQWTCESFLAVDDSLAVSRSKCNTSCKVLPCLPNTTT